MLNRLPQWLNALCLAALPALLVTLTATAVWRAGYRVQDAQAPLLLPIKAVSIVGAVTPEQALQQLQAVVPSLHRDTARSEQPFWFSFQVDKPLGMAVELVSRHATEVACWSTAPIELLGAADRANTKAALSRVNAGFQIDLHGMAESKTFICRSEFRGPARIEVKLWRETDLQAANDVFALRAGMLDGAGIVLAICMLAVGLYSREPLYGLLGAWLLGNLRIAALSAGMDFSWLGFPIPPEWLYVVRKLTYAAYYVLSVLVFAGLFRSALQSPARTMAVKTTEVSALLLLLAAALPYGQFLPVLWVLVTAGGLTQLTLLLTLPRQQRTAVSVWFATGLAMTLAGSLSEVAAAASGWKLLVGAINNVSGALASSALGVLALAAHVRQERSQRVNAQKQAMVALNKLRESYQASPVGLFTLSLPAHTKGMTPAPSIHRYNPAFATMLGYTLPRNQPIDWEHHFPDSDTLLRLAGAEQPVEHEIAGRDHHGEARWYLLTVQRTEENALGSALLEGTLQDITERRRATERLRFLADHDPLTELLNRRGVETVLDNVFQLLAKQQPLAVGYLDLDRFKLVNDLYGHPVGDRVLKQLTERVVMMLGPDNVLARVGGDEFVLVLPHLPIEPARTLCEQVIATISSEPFSVDERLVRIEGSIGLIEVVAGMTIHDAIATADRACRDAKSRHDGSLVVYEHSAAAFAERTQELAIIHKIGTGAVMQQLYLEMQPIMSLAAPHDSLNFEVLLRMRDDGGKALPTARLVSAAENSGLMPHIDRWVLRNMLEWLDTHLTQLDRTRFVCVNLSGVSLNDERFIADALSMLREHPKASQLLCLEVTETVALHDLMNTRRWIDQLRRCGAKVALDDFGAGYTSLSYLRDLPADALKIDGAFIRNINEHAANHSIVQVVIELAHNLGMRTIAEWVEDRHVLETLTALGADYAQGWAIAKSQPPESILAARSAASFITDEATLTMLQETSGVSSWGAFKERLFPLSVGRQK